MKILLLGYGKEGKSAEKYIKTHFKNPEIDILENFNPKEICNKDYSLYDIIFRSPSVPPLNLKNESSVTKYFFDHCPCEVIGVTATKGKGTISSLIQTILNSIHKTNYLVGNIGSPAIDILDNLTPNDTVVYEMSSFQLWDLHKSPHIAVIGTIEPDHLNVHNGYDDYLDAKSHICKYQQSSDYTIYYKDNPTSVSLAEQSSSTKISYPFEVPPELLAALNLPGNHNKENALAAIAAVSCLLNLSTGDFITKYHNQIQTALKNVKSLPHRLEFLREHNNVKYYDDNFSSNIASTKVAIDAFPNDNLTIIIGGRDKTNYEDLPELYNIISKPQVKNIILIGESGHELYQRYQDPRFHLKNSLEDAVKTAQKLAEASAYQSSEKSSNIVLMSPAAASFDMFKDFYERGAKYQTLINNLP